MRYIPHRMKRLLLKTVDERVLLFLLVVAYIAVRSFHFANVLDFSTDQALFSIKALEMLRTKHLTLIGPTFSINVNGRYAFTGPAIYYFQLVFLMLGNFDPVLSSYVFMLFSAVMVVPLFYGVKFLLGKNAAWFMAGVYALTPFYIDYTRFLWNPNYQFALMPLGILLTGIFAVRRKWGWFFVLSIYLGFLLQFHYQFGVILVGYFVYFFVLQKLGWRYFLLWLLGLSIGFSPIFFFELRYQFYNTQTILLFVKQIFTNTKFHRAGLDFNPHYVLSISFFAVLSVVAILRKYMTPKVVQLSFIVLGVWALAHTVPAPTHAFGMPANWNYLKEEKAYSLIRSNIAENRISNYAVASLNYDTLSPVQKYFLTRDNLDAHINNYTTSLFLYVIATPEEYRSTQAYEVTSFQPATAPQIIGDLGGGYVVYFLRRK